MESIKEIYKIGYGPSSSHTMGPRNAAEIFLNNNSGNSTFRVTLFGSLALTGKGHLTDKAIQNVFKDKKLELQWKENVFLPEHPNGILFEAFDNSNQVTKTWKVFSVGGGDISEDGKPVNKKPIYEHSSMKDILEWCNNNGKTFKDYVFERENENLESFLNNVWDTMLDTLKKGLETEGVIAGALKLPRKASSYFNKAGTMTGPLKVRGLLFSYALATAEENASGGKVVTAPTCGSCGVLPAVLFHSQKIYKFPKARIINALAVAGLIGNLVKKNASISGAKVGCQGEIGTACSMAAAAVAHLQGGTPSQIEYAAQMGLEHFLGLTCDPIAGLVQVPCIERNAYAAARALDINIYSLLSDGRHMVTFDKVVEAMNRTGHDMPKIYKETSLGGLAALW